MTQSTMFSLLALSTPVVSVIVGVVVLAVAIPLGMFLNTFISKKKSDKNKTTAANIIQEALNEAKTVKKEAVLEAKDEVLRLKNECDAELKERRAEVQKAENRIAQREDFITKREMMLDAKSEQIDNMKSELENKEQEIEKTISEQKNAMDKIVAELEKVSGLSKEEAKNELISKFEEEAKKDAAVLVRNIEQTAKDEAEKKAREDNFWENIEVGEIVEGQVVRFASFGAFVNVRGFDCLAHISDLSWTPIKEPSEVLELNKTYEFVVLKLDREASRVSIGYKQLLPDPWQVAFEKHPVGSVTKGKVARILPFGAFVEIEPGVDGLLHVSNVSWEWVDDIKKVLKVGDEIDVAITEFNPESKRVTLSRKATMEQPQDASENK